MMASCCICMRAHTHTHTLVYIHTIKWPPPPPLHLLILLLLLLPLVSFLLSLCIVIKTGLWPDILLMQVVCCWLVTWLRLVIPFNQIQDYALMRTLWELLFFIMADVFHTTGLSGLTQLELGLNKDGDARWGDSDMEILHGRMEELMSFSVL